MIIKKIKAIKDLFYKLLYIMTPGQKRLLAPVMLVVIISSSLQTLGVSVFAPLVSAMTDSEGVMKKAWAVKVCEILNLDSSSDLFVVLCILVITIYLCKEAFSLFQSWVSIKYANKVHREISSSVLETYMKREYDFFLNYGTAKIMRDVTDDPFKVNLMITALLNITSEGLTMLLILIYIFVSDVQMALCITVIAIVCLILIYFIFRKKTKEAGKRYRELLAINRKILLQSVEGIKEVQVMRRQKYFLKNYKDSYAKFQEPSVVVSIASAAPVYIVEGLFVSGILLFMIYKVISDPDYATFLPLLASFMVGAIRMLPSMGRISSNINTFTFHVPSLISAYENVKRFRTDPRFKEEVKIVQDEKIVDFEMKFDRCLQLEDVCWHYPDSDKNVLNKLNLTVNKGESVGIIGQSGAGKSTLADVILGLHVPQSGKVLLDDQDIFMMPDAYSRVIGFVPQSVYLIEGTIRENVAFGVDDKDIDDTKVWDCLKKAQLSEFVDKHGQKLDTVIGERGVKLSGGQRQRIAIARALYRDPQLLILDEATSALDNETESAVMDAIEGLYGTITIVIIAHRLTTVKKCNTIYEITDGMAIKRSIEEIL